MKRILDIPEAYDVMQDQDRARLHESGWFEDIVAFEGHIRDWVEKALP